MVSIAQRTRNPLSVAIIDIDDFKKVNDTYGHSVGDEVIKHLANKLIDVSKEEYIPARIGGEEFAILFPNTNIEDAYDFIEYCRNDIENTTLSIENQTIKFTISIGVDKFDFNKDKNISSSLNRADKALYKAKIEGKNRVIIFTKDMVASN